MDNIYEKYTAGGQLIGFDYQFYYFMYLALDLRQGETIGFEVKDDVHIDKSDGSVILFQAKHTISTKSDGTSTNLTTLDVDLWKSLNNWSDLIKKDNSILDNHYFCLVTNKGDDSNDFITALKDFNSNDNIDDIGQLLAKLKKDTKSDTINKYLKNIMSLGKKRSKLFYSRLMIETNFDNIIDKIKNKIRENCRNNVDLVEPIFESLSSNLNVAKYLDIKNRNKFEITFEEFNNRFGKCFRIAYKDKPLPKRSFDIQLPDNIDNQIFIKQLIDIGEISLGSTEVIEYTSQMLQAVNNLLYWSNNNFILPTEIDEFKKEAILKWKNEFRSKYRQIERRINSGSVISDMEDEIKELGIEMIDFIRKEDLIIATNFCGIELSNGHYYALSDKPEIGWHYDWEQKYK